MRPTLFLFLISLLLGGCYSWEASDKPVSGIKVSKPVYAEDYAGQFYVMSGSIVANQSDSIRYAINYTPNRWEQFGGANYTSANETRTQVLEPTQTVFADSFNLPTATLPGRYLFYSRVRDRSGTWSDTNKTYRRIIRPEEFPSLISSTPIRPTSTNTETVSRTGIGSTVLTLSVARDTVGFDSVVYRRCRVLDRDSLACVRVGRKIIGINPETGDKFKYSSDSGQFPIPATAVRTERYRLQTIYYNTKGNSYTWQPLYQIN